MADRRFFHNAGPLTLSAVAQLTGAKVVTDPEKPSDGNRAFSDVASLDIAGPGNISFLDNPKYIEAFAASSAGACFVRPRQSAKAPKDMVLFLTEEPYYAYALTAQKFYPDPPFTPGIAPQAAVAGSATIGRNTRIDPGAVIGENVQIGESCRIGANTVIDDGVQIGNGCRIGANCTLSHAILGNRVLLHRGIHIGQDGFGFAPGPKGIAKVPQLGRVIIGDDVEIGAGTCIDRGAGPDTIIGAGSKIDNLVMIGHNVQLGKYVIITGQCGISGSTHLGDGVIMGAQTGLAGHLRVGSGVKLAARSGVIHDIPAGEIYGGAPAIPIKDWRRQMAAISRLGKRKEDK